MAKRNLSTHSRGKALKCGLLFALSLLMAPAARADIISYWNGPADFHYNVTNMPDIDQRRADLFVNGNLFAVGFPNSGEMYCVPTSTMDLLAYIANHGFPTVNPGPGDWSVSPPDPGYNFVSNQILALAAAMGTDPVMGTTDPNAVQASVQLVLDLAAPGDFTVSVDYAHDNYSPLFMDMAQLAISGSLICPGIGWYSQPLPDFEHNVRVGGHQLALSYASPTLIGNTPYVIGWSDPANDEYPNHNYFKQSPFTQDIYNVEDRTAFYSYVDANGNPIEYFWRTQTRVGDYGGILDGCLSITPTYALASDGITISAFYPISFVTIEGLKQKTFTPVGGKKVMDLVINPVRTQHPYIVEDSNAVWLLQVLDGTSKRFVEVDHPKRIVQGGRNLNLYVVCPEHLVCFDRIGRRRAQVHLRDPLAAVAYDDFHNHVVGVSSHTNTLYVFDPTDLHIVSSFPLPPGATMHHRRISLAANPSRGTLYVHVDGSTKVTLLAFAEGRGFVSSQVTLIGTERPRGLFVDERGMLFVTDGGLVKSFFPNGMPAERNRFAGFRGGRIFQILRPHSNFDPALKNSPSFHNVLPENARR
jgi:hypothetical protein